METEKLPITAIVLTYNEEENIISCLESLVRFVGEIIIVDSGSNDETLKLVSLYTDKIFYHPFINYSIQRNWAQRNLEIKYKWVLHMDADERVSDELAGDIRHFFKNREHENRIAGIHLRRRIEFLGKHIKYGGIYPTYHCRLFIRERGRCEEREYDQHFIVDGPTVTMKGDFIENTARSVHSWTMRHLRWAEMEAQFLYRGGFVDEKDMVRPRIMGTAMERRRWMREFYERMPLFLRALIYFTIRYFIRGGFLDGYLGLIYHFLHGFWFRFYIDACIFEYKRMGKIKS